MIAFEDSIERILRRIIREELTDVLADRRNLPVKNQQSTSLNRVQLAKALQVHVSSVDRWRAAGAIPFMKTGRSIRFDLAAVKAALQTQDQKNLSAATSLGADDLLNAKSPTEDSALD